MGSFEFGMYNGNFMEDTLKAKLETYRPSKGAIKLVNNTNILLLVGISGAGKDTTKIQLLKHGGYHHIVSHTTRPPRFNHGIMEQDGVDYHFIDLAQANKLVDEQKFIEAKIYSGNVYGTSISEIEVAHNAGQTAVTDLEVQGVVEYKSLNDRVTAVFLLPPDYATWQARLQQRYAGGEIDQVDMKKRMHTASLELQHALETDYFHFVVNDDLTQTVQTVHHLAHAHTRATPNSIAQKLAIQLEKQISSRA